MSDKDKEKTHVDSTVIEESMKNMSEQMKKLTKEHERISQVINSIVEANKINQLKDFLNNPAFEADDFYTRVNIEPNKSYKVENSLKTLLAFKGYSSQQEFAEKIGVSPKTLSNIINNRFNTSLDVALKISYILKVPVNDIFKLTIEDEE